MSPNGPMKQTKKTNSKSNNAFELRWALLNLEFSPTSTALSEQSQKKGVK